MNKKELQGRMYKMEPFTKREGSDEGRLKQYLAGKEGEKEMQETKIVAPEVCMSKAEIDEELARIKKAKKEEKLARIVREFNELRADDDFDDVEFYIRTRNGTDLIESSSRVLAKKTEVTLFE